MNGKTGEPTASGAVLLSLMVWEGTLSRREGTSWPRAQEPDSSAGG
jgi:hypothetical protein